MRLNIFIIFFAWVNLSFAQVLLQAENYQLNIKPEWGSSPVDRAIFETLGAEIEQLTYEEARALGLNAGIRINRILLSGKFGNNSPKTGFIITHFNKEAIFNLETLHHLLKNSEGPIILRGFYESLLGRNAGIGEISIYTLAPQ
ncbi:MAG: hypothetical protein R8P61_32615 [Bacteroidia bacterium]|nr:hypothetical protein [Bacteroidia bacterium]